MNTLQTLTYMKSPRDKLTCILQSLQDTVHCVQEFWRENNVENIIVGADDLVPIYTYTLYLSNIPNLISEMNFIWDLANDVELSGKYGYSYATFQLAVSIISNMEINEDISDIIQ